MRLFFNPCGTPFSCLYRLGRNLLLELMLAVCLAVLSGEPNNELTRQTAINSGTIPPSFPNLFVNTSKEPTSAVIGQLTSHRLKHEGSVLSKFKTSPTPVTKMRMSLNTYTAAKSAASVPSFSSSSSSSSNVKKYRCDICNKTFSRSNTLITHKVRPHHLLPCLEGSICWELPPHGTATSLAILFTVDGLWHERAR